VKLASAPGRDRAVQASSPEIRSSIAQVTVDVRLVGASGIGTYIRNVLPRIIAARPHWQFHLLGRPEELNQCPWSAADRVRVIPCDAPVYGLTEQVQLARRIPAQTDVMWSPHYNIPVLWRGRLLVTVHDVCHLALPHLISGVHRRAYARLMFAAVKRRASRLVCVSDFTSSEFLRLVGRPRHMVTIHNGVSPGWFSIQPRERPHPRPFILFVGNVKPHKNLTTLIRAFERITHRVPHDLIIVGRHSDFITSDPSVSKAAARAGERVRLAGEVAPELLKQFFRYAEALVFPSLYEGFGLPPLEAMACGCPTVVARAGSLPEVCGSASVYFDPADPDDLADALLRVLSDDRLREELRQQGRDRAAEFDWDRSARKTLGILEELLVA
jgi:glycosyltransferase involved in cell wall biosynthesis